MKEYREIVEKIYNKQYAILKYFGLWELSPDSAAYSLKTFHKIYWYFLIFFMVLLDWSMIMQVFTNINNLDEVIKVFFILATAIAVLGKYLQIKIKNQAYENFFKLLNNIKFLPANDQEREIFLQNIKLGAKVRIFYTYLSLTALTGLIMTQYLGATDDLIFNIYSPIELNTGWKQKIVYYFECLSLVVMCFVNIAFDSLSTSLFIHVKCQLDMLGHRLENIGENATASQGFICQQLKDCVRYYNRILLLSRDIENLVSVPISLQIACSVFVLIANFYAMSLLSDPEELPNFLKFAIYQSCMLTQIFMLCYCANEISLKSSELSFNLYMSDWYNWNKLNRKLVLLMMIRFGEPIRINTINRCYSFNLPLFVSIVNSSYSYFALLNRVNG